LSQFVTLAADINRLRNLLKTKTFIPQKSLDTPVFRLIRFPQKVLTDFKAPLELFSLEEEAALLPGGLFVFALHSSLQSFCARGVNFAETIDDLRGNCSALSTYQLL
jgi:hypothetical protein